MSFEDSDLVFIDFKSEFEHFKQGSRNFKFQFEYFKESFIDFSFAFKNSNAYTGCVCPVKVRTNDHMLFDGFHIFTVKSKEHVATRSLLKGDCFMRSMLVVCALNDLIKLKPSS